jgi:2-succinyl-6-hydroxy-2,4-cyclohexadiene-1-carboxylate synthase
MRAPAVLFLPGFMQHADAWAEVADAVGERYPSAVLDFATATYAARIEEIEAAAPPGAVLVGYSMGGRLALHAAVRDPARYGALVLLGVSAGIEDPAERAARAEADEELAAWIERNPMPQVVARWERNPVFATQRPSLVERQRPGRLSHEPRDLALLLRTAGQGALEPMWDRLPELTMPVLALAGEYDPRYRKAAAHIAELVRVGRAEEVPGAGHAAQLEAPYRTAAALADFLDEHFGDGLVGDLDA